MATRFPKSSYRTVRLRRTRHRCGHSDGMFYGRAQRRKKRLLRRTNGSMGSHEYNRVSAGMVGILFYAMLLEINAPIDAGTLIIRANKKYNPPHLSTKVIRANVLRGTGFL